MCNRQSGFVGQAFGMVGGYRSKWPKALGRRCPVIAPILLIYVLAQRRFFENTTFSGTKE